MKKSSGTLEKPLNPLAAVLTINSCLSFVNFVLFLLHFDWLVFPVVLEI